MEWKTFDWKNKEAVRKGEILTKTVYRCGFCKGTGLAPSQRFTKCPVCLGDGSVRVTPPAIICAYCNRKGSSRLNRDLPCIVCRGKGVVSISSKDIQICPDCKGKGRKRGSELSCLTCKGKGVIPIKGNSSANRRDAETQRKT
ncbi:MAG: hypothetical protein ABH870_07675 [bacterium]